MISLSNVRVNQKFIREPVGAHIEREYSTASVVNALEHYGRETAIRYYGEPVVTAVQEWLRGQPAPVVVSSSNIPWSTEFAAFVPFVPKSFNSNVMQHAG